MQRSDKFGYDYSHAEVDPSATINAIQAIGTKRITAMPMTRQQYNDYRGWVLPRGEDGADEGYLVEYEDGPSIHPKHAGYISWSPKAVFDGSYQPTSAMSFGHALFAMEKGATVCRIGWNGKGMWLVLVREWSGAFGRDLPIDWSVAPFIAMKTADNKMVPWLCSQTDMLANDWMVL